MVAETDVEGNVNTANELELRFAMPLEIVTSDLMPSFILGVGLPLDLECPVFQPEDLKGRIISDFDYFQIFQTGDEKGAHWVGDTPVDLKQVKVTRSHQRICVMVDNPIGEPYPMRVDEYLSKTDGEPYLLAFLRPDAKINEEQQMAWFGSHDARIVESKSTKRKADVDSDDDDDDKKMDAILSAQALFTEMQRRREETEGSFQDRFSARILKDYGDAVDDKSREGSQAVAMRAVGELMGFDGKHKILIHAPPRYGKTWLSSRLIELANEVSDPKDAIVYVTLSRVALEDVEKELQQNWKNVYGNDAELPYARWYSEKDSIQRFTKVVLTSYQSCEDAMQNLKNLGRNTRLVILDEAHAIAGVRRTIEHIDANNYVAVAMTATPGGRINSLENLGFTEAIRVTPLEQIEGGRAPPTRIRRFVTEVLPETHQALIDGGSEMTGTKLQRFLQDSVYLQTVVHKAIELATNKDEDGMIVSFKRSFLQAKSINQVEEIVQQLQNSPYTSHLADRIGMIHSGYTPTHNRRVLDAYRNGEIDVLVGISMIKQSVHLPGLEVIFPTPTLSPIHIGQTVGRGMNPDKPELLVVEIFPTEWPEAVGYKTTPQFLGITENYQFGSLFSGRHARRSFAAVTQGANQSTLPQRFIDMVHSTSREVTEFRTFDRKSAMLYELVQTPVGLFALYHEFRATHPTSSKFVNYFLESNEFWPKNLRSIIHQWIDAGLLPPDSWVETEVSSTQNSLDSYFALLYAVQAPENQYAAWLHEQFFPNFEHLVEQGVFPPMIGTLRDIEELIIGYIQQKQYIQESFSNTDHEKINQAKPSYWVRNAVDIYLRSSQEGRVLKEWMKSIRIALQSAYVPREIQHKITPLWNSMSVHIHDYIGEVIYSRIQEDNR